MGIRIHKNIGYYLVKKNISHILVKNYDEILDDLSFLDKPFFKKMAGEMEQIFGKNHIGLTYAEIQLQQLIKNNTKKQITFDTFVKSIYHHDTFKGVIFQTPELSKASKFDDLIDYYEHVDNPMFKANLLKQSLYPDNYYICIKVPTLTKEALEVYASENPRKPILEVGDLVSSDKLHYIMLYNKIGHERSAINKWAYPTAGSEKYFHPYVNVLTYVASKVAGILKPDLSYVEFSQYLEPAIITYWG